MIFLAAGAVVLQLVASSSAFTLECRFWVASWTGIGQVYQCTSIQSFDPSDQTITAVVGVHLPGRDNSHVQLLHFIRNLTFVPQGKTTFFPNLVGLRLDEVDIETFHGDEVEEVEKLEFFTIHHSGVRTVSSRLFRNAPNLKLVDFFSNRLEEVGYHLFTPVNIEQLRFVSFGQNVCINESVLEQNPARVRALIENLRANCTFHDEELTTTAEPTTTSEHPSCIFENIEEAVCDLKDAVVDLGDAQSQVELELVATKDQLATAMTDIEKLQAQVGWLTEEILRLSANPEAPPF